MTKNTKRVVFSLGRAGLVFFLLGMSFLVFTFFLFGLRVGMHLDAYPEKIALLPEKVGVWIKGDVATGRENLAPLPEVAPEETPATPAAKENYPPEASPPFLASEPAVVVPPPPLASPSPETPVAVTGAKETKEIAKADPPLDENDKKAAANQKSKNVPNRYVVQIGAFKERGKAEKLQGRMASRGYRPAIENRTPGAGAAGWFRVVVGDYSSMEEARRAMDRIKKRHPELDCLVKPRGSAN